MKTDFEIRRLFDVNKKEKFLKEAAIKAGLHVQTARKYLKSRRLPSELKKEHTRKSGMK